MLQEIAGTTLFLQVLCLTRRLKN